MLAGNSQPTAAPDVTALNIKVMERLARTWSERVAVRKDRLDLDAYYDPTIPDFPIEIIPFARDPEFQEAYDRLDDRAKLRYLAAVWIGYNERVIFIEDDIVQPVCGLLRKNRLPGVADPVVQQVIAQTQVDEQFHTLMCLEVCESARRRHGIRDYRLPPPLLAKRMREQLDAADGPYAHALIRTAYGTVSETTIHDYLRKLSTVETIQPLNRIHTELHRRDETAHGTIFLELARSIYANLDSGAKELFHDIFERALHDSVEIDVDFWASTLPYVEARDWTPFVQRLRLDLAQKRIGRDYTGLRQLLDDLGITARLDFVFE